MRRPSFTVRGGPRHQVAELVVVNAPTSGLLAKLLQRVQQWLTERKRLLAAWFVRFSARTAPKLLQRKQGGAGAMVLPFWWEYESELKCRLALEAVLRHLFSLLPEPKIVPA